MVKQFSAAVDTAFPTIEERPRARPTFMFTGIAVKWSGAPTTSENLSLVLSVEKDVEVDVSLKVIDPSTDSLTDWFWTVPDGPIPLPEEVQMKVAYGNTDTNTVTIVFLGYYV